MPRRKCTRKQLAALKRGRNIAHKRSKKTTNAPHFGKAPDKAVGAIFGGKIMPGYAGIAAATKARLAAMKR